MVSFIARCAAVLLLMTTMSLWSIMNVLAELDYVGTVLSSVNPDAEVLERGFRETFESSSGYVLARLKSRNHAAEAEALSDRPSERAGLLSSARSLAMPSQTASPKTSDPSHLPTASPIVVTATPTLSPFKGLIMNSSETESFGYLADPNALVVNGTIYVFCSTDPPTASRSKRYSSMREYSLLTTTSMDENTVWTYHGVILSPAKQFGNLTRVYANKLMFAPTAVYRDGWFYLYFPFLWYQGAPSQIGVAKSRDPTNQTSWELVIPSLHRILMSDPCVMKDPTGQLYLYGHTRRKSEDPRDHRILAARLGNNMKSVLGGRPTAVRDAFVTEAVFVFWRKHPTTGVIWYYFMARRKTVTGADSLRYWRSQSPLPRILKNKLGRAVSPNQYDAPAHASVIEFKGKHYLFYHTGLANDGNPWKRSACVDELTFSNDGHIRPVSFSCPYADDPRHRRRFSSPEA